MSKKISETVSIVYEADATRYEILVTLVNNPDSHYDKLYVVSLINFNECFIESDLRFVGFTIHDKSTFLSGVDAKNIHNAIAKHFPYMERVKYDQDTDRLFFDN